MFIAGSRLLRSNSVVHQPDLACAKCLGLWPNKLRYFLGGDGMNPVLKGSVAGKVFRDKPSFEVFQTYNNLMRFQAALCSSAGQNVSDEARHRFFGKISFQDRKRKVRSIGGVDQHLV